ncbi:hypothetical protein LTR67_002614 [Exophiala xenobiotica]
MDFQPARRKMNTYGKGPRRVMVHDLFGPGAVPAIESTKPITLLEHTQNASKTVTRPGLEVAGPITETCGPNWVTESQQFISTSNASTPQSSPMEATGRTLFDVQSSEEESTRPHVKRPLKKRKVTPIPDKPKSKPSVSFNPTEIQRTVKSRTIQPAMKKSLQSVGALKETEKGSVKPGDSKQGVRTARVKEQPRKAMTPDEAEGNEARFRPMLDRNGTASQSHTKTTGISSGSSVMPSEESDRHTTPKRKRGLLKDEFRNSPSPPALQMTSLRLTPDLISQELELSSSDEEMVEITPVMATPRRGRKRLIDRLDAPQPYSTDNGPSKLSLGRSVSGTTSPRGPLVEAHKSAAAPNVGLPPRQRATYARQRSHLSDMLDSLDNYSGVNSQASSQQSFSQPVSFGLASQMELELEDSDEADNFTQLKSIHELRRGAAISKYDQDIESILEDIESQSKSLRILALLLLINKIKELSFLRHFQESGSSQRFTACANGDLDLVTAAMMVVVFHKLITAKQSSPKNQLQILSALYRLPRELSLQRRSLSKLAKDRSENLSKVLIRDITTFEEQQHGNGAQRSDLVSLRFLSSIKDTLGDLVSSREQVPDLPRPLLDAFVLAFNRERKHVAEESDRTDRFDGIQVLLSLLESACANRDLVASTLSMSSVIEVGSSIATVMTIARQAQAETQHSCLRLLVSLSNNEPRVCEALAEGKLIATVFQVIDDHFLRLAALASQEQQFDNAQLESVILAVGCLLNIAECADAARRKMLELDAREGRLVDKLVNMFNSHVDRTSEALTIDQTQILVAFGYISALLCTLCLNADARKRISDTIRGEGLSQLFEATGIFLDHLQTVEKALGDEGGASSGFTGRFTMVLDALREEIV